MYGGIVKKDQWAEVAQSSHFNVVYAKSLAEAQNKIKEEISDTWCIMASAFKNGKISIGLVEANVEQNWLWNIDDD